MSNVKIVLANKTNKQAIEDWEEFLAGIRNATPVDVNESDEEKAKRIKWLEKEGNEEEWFKYYFPKYCFAPAASFQKKSTKKVLKAKRLYQRRAWARGLAKSTRRMFEIMYKKFVQKLKVNMILISYTETNAIKLLSVYRANLEANQRLINDYGVQERPGKWSEEYFLTRDGSAFLACGRGQNPRGTKLEELRVNVLCFDDVDEDEVCRNPERLQQAWEWIEQAAIPTVDISKDYYIFFDNNIIAEDSIAVRAGDFADDKELINIRDANGVSVWPEKNSEADIDYMLSIISYESGQKEYFNNPLTQGKTFKEIIWGKCPSLKTLRFVVAYADPATSNKDKPSVKSKAQNSCKAVVLLGYKDLKYYVYTAFVDNTTNSNFIDWMYAIEDYIATKAVAYFFIENNTLQDPFYQQVFLPLIYGKAKQDRRPLLPITPDTRDKPEKWFRIEGTLEPINRLGQLVFNEEEKANPHMLRLEAQFKAAKATSKVLDGPDAVEGGVFKIKEKIIQDQPNQMTIGKRPRNKFAY